MKAKYELEVMDHKNHKNSFVKEFPKRLSALLTIADIYGYDIVEDNLLSIISGERITYGEIEFSIRVITPSHDDSLGDELDMISHKDADLYDEEDYS